MWKCKFCGHEMEGKVLVTLPGKCPKCGKNFAMIRNEGLQDITCMHPKKIVLDAHDSRDRWHYLVACKECNRQAWVSQYTADRIIEIPNYRFTFYGAHSSCIGEPWKKGIYECMCEGGH